MFASRYTTERYKVNFDFLPRQADAVDLLGRGKLDLILHIDDGLLPSHSSSERLYREDWICAVALQSEFGFAPPSWPIHSNCRTHNNIHYRLLRANVIHFVTAKNYALATS
jgi:hypothetical protein